MMLGALVLVSEAAVAEIARQGWELGAIQRLHIDQQS